MASVAALSQLFCWSLMVWVRSADRLESCLPQVKFWGIHCFSHSLGSIMQRLIGFALLLAGIYFLGKDIMFSTYYSPFFWRSLPAMGSVVAISTGVVALVFFPRQTGLFGWGCLVLGILLVFLSGGIFLKPVSLWNFVVALTSMAVGYKLISQRQWRL